MSKPLLCVTVTAPTTAELRRRRDAVADADLIELRLDTVSDPGAPAALDGRRMSGDRHVPPGVGGREFNGHGGRAQARSWPTRSALGAEYVDVEWRARFRRSDRADRRPPHRAVDARLRRRADRSRPRACARCGRPARKSIKIAVTLHRAQRLRAAARSRRAERRRTGVVLDRHGPVGVVTRVLAGRFGSGWTYAGALHEIGQVARASLLDDYRFRSIGRRDATIYGVVGHPVTHSVSPAMHNAAFRAVARRRGLPAAAGGERRRFHRPSAARSASAARA